MEDISPEPQEPLEPQEEPQEVQEVPQEGVLEVVVVPEPAPKRRGRRPGAKN